MKPVIPLLGHICTWFYRKRAVSYGRRWGLIAWILPIVAVIAFASIGGGQEPLQESDSPDVADEAASPNDDMARNDKDEDDLDTEKKDKSDEATYSYPTTSSPISLSADNQLLWVVNPTDNSVSVIRTDTKHVIRKIKVGKERQSVALDPRYDLRMSPMRLHQGELSSGFTIPRRTTSRLSVSNNSPPERSLGTWSCLLMVGASLLPTAVKIPLQSSAGEQGASLAMLTYDRVCAMTRIGIVIFSLAA